MGYSLFLYLSLICVLKYIVDKCNYCIFVYDF